MIISRVILLRVMNVSYKVVEKINTFFPKTMPFVRSCGKILCRARQATHDNIIRRMRIACWMAKAADTHSEFLILLFHGSNGYANAAQCCMIAHLHIACYTDGRKQCCLVIYLTMLSAAKCL